MSETMRTIEPSNVLAALLASGLVPAVRTSTAELARTAAGALVAAGITTLEIPCTVPDALDVIAELRRGYGDSVVIGAGTVLGVPSTRAAIGKGAQFIVSPALNVEVVRFCRKEGVVCLPGALTPTEVWTAWQAEADMVKVFPVSAMGGPPYIRALLTTFPELRLMPMGGVSVETAEEYLAVGAAVLGVGQDLVNSSIIATYGTSEVCVRARAYLGIVSSHRSPKGKA